MQRGCYRICGVLSVAGPLATQRGERHLGSELGDTQDVDLWVGDACDVVAFSRSRRILWCVVRVAQQSLQSAITLTQSHAKTTRHRVAEKL